MLIILVQSLNAQLSILVMLAGIVILVRLAQPLNADAPIDVTLAGIIMLVRLVTFQECLLVDKGNAVGYGYAGKAGTVAKCAMPDRGNA